MPQSKTLNHDRIAAMLRMGATPRQVAQRLRCSTRHVRRIANTRGIQVVPNPLIGTDQERRTLWRTLHENGCSYARIAYLMGRSRQAVAAYFSQPA